MKEEGLVLTPSDFTCKRRPSLSHTSLALTRAARGVVCVWGLPGPDWHQWIYDKSAALTIAHVRIPIARVPCDEAPCPDIMAQLCLSIDVVLYPFEVSYDH